MIQYLIILAMLVAYGLVIAWWVPLAVVAAIVLFFVWSYWGSGRGGLFADTAKRCSTCGGRGWHTDGGNDPMACGRCPAGEAFDS